MRMNNLIPDSVFGLKIVIPACLPTGRQGPEAVLKTDSRQAGVT